MAFLSGVGLVCAFALLFEVRLTSCSVINVLVKTGAVIYYAGVSRRQYWGYITDVRSGWPDENQGNCGEQQPAGRRMRDRIYGGRKPLAAVCSHQRRGRANGNKPMLKHSFGESEAENPCHLKFRSGIKGLGEGTLTVIQRRCTEHPVNIHMV
jgi:hypothetical protein